MATSVWFAEWFQENKESFSGELRFDEPLARHTYYRIGGPARVFAIPKTLEDLNWFARGIRSTGIPLFVLGLGSNLLVSDEGFQGLVLKTSRLNLEIFPIGDTHSPELRVRTGASVAISTLLRKASEKGWSGLELLTGVPGSVGGAVAMNAGTHLGESKDALFAVEYFKMTGASAGEGYEPTRVEGVNLKFSYRHNDFLPDDAVVWATEWKIRQDDPSKVKAMIDEILVRRKSTQPLDAPSCGSVFKNPKGRSGDQGEGLNAWQVIDRLGLRGHRIGDAQISEKHCNFIVNLGSARAADVRALITLVKDRALQELGIQMDEEVCYLPKGGPHLLV